MFVPGGGYDMKSECGIGGGGGMKPPPLLPW
jgi:hypothetical protein